MDKITTAIADALASAITDPEPPVEIMRSAPFAFNFDLRSPAEREKAAKRAAVEERENGTGDAASPV